MSEWILAADIGGTKINLACFNRHDGPLAPLKERSYATTHFPSLEAILANFLDGGSIVPAAVCFGIPGAAGGDHIEAVNLPWVIDRQSLQTLLKVSRVHLINDLVATAYGVCVLSPGHYELLNEGRANNTGNAVLLAAGTGLGEGLLIRNGQGWLPAPSEGGHADFAPADELQCEMLHHLQSVFGHVSFERVLSGPGLFNIYKFLRDTGRGEEPDWLDQKLAKEDPSAVIAKTAQEGKSHLCAQAMEMFVRIYGQEAGNMAVKIWATGGVYIGGGIAPKILPWLKSPTFMDAFFTKGRLSEMMRDFPVRVILEPRAALFGAAHYAMMQDK